MADADADSDASSFDDRHASPPTWERAFARLLVRLLAALAARFPDIAAAVVAALFGTLPVARG
jgi:hypothetical protein